jgi:hypothetical protein
MYLKKIRHNPGLGMLPQIMKSRLMKARIAAADAGEVTQPPEGGVYQSVVESLILS